MRRLSVQDIMTREVVTVGEDTGYKDIVAAMVRNRASAATVVAPDGQVVGVVSEADLLHKAEFIGAAPGLLDRRQSRQLRTKAAARVARDIMTTPAMTTRATVAVADVAVFMESARVGLLPVVDSDGHVVGSVSRRDVLGIYLVDDEALRAEIVQSVVQNILTADTDTIDVSTARGIVTVSGSVDRRSTAELVVQLVETVAGVVDVLDQLHYRYDDQVDVSSRQLVSPPGTVTVAS